MSVFPQFLDHIHELGMYVDGYNYEEMYNIMVYNLTYNIISTNNFIYTYAFMNQLYDYLEELLLDSDTESEPEINNINNLPINDDTITQNNQPTNQDNALQLFQNYIITSLNNQNLNQNTYNITNINNNTNDNINNNTNNEFTYTNLVYYNNI